VAANVTQPLNGADFLSHYGLLVDCRNDSLLDSITSLSAPAQAARSLVPSVKIITDVQAIDSLLSRVPGPHSPNRSPARGTSPHCPPHRDHNKPTSHMPATSTGTEPTRYRQSRVQGHVAGRHGSSLREFLVVCPTNRSQERQRLATLLRLLKPQCMQHSRPLSRPSYTRLLSPAFRLFDLFRNRSGESIKPNSRESW
jgi:hypothetical protein